MMNESRLSPDDPKLTAYALGELQGDERAAVEAALRHDPEARAAVEQIRAFSAQLEFALANEPEDTAATSGQPAEAKSLRRVAIVPGNDLRKLDGGPLPQYEPKAAKLFRFPQLYYVIGGLAAACVAVMVALREEKPMPPRKTFVLHLTPPSASEVSVNAPVAKADSTETTSTTEAVTAEPEQSVSPEKEAPKTQVAIHEAARPVVPRPLPLDTKPVVEPPGKTEIAAAKPAADAPRPFVAAMPEKNAFLSDQPGGVLSTRAQGGLASQEATASNRYVIPGDISLSAPSTPAAATVGRQTAVPRKLGELEPRLASSNATVTPVTSHYGSTSTQPPAQRPTVAKAAESEEVVRLSAFAVSTTPRPGFWSRVKSAFKGKNHDARTAENVAPSAPPSPNPAARTEPSVLAGTRVGQTERTSVQTFGLPPDVRTERSTVFNTESYAYQHDNAFVTPAQSPFSTFSIDVDTASYSNVRRFVENGQVPPPAAVRIEELLNYFPYHYAAPAPAGSDPARTDASAAPIAASLEVAEAPWAPTHRLVRIGLKAREIPATERPSANLVFLIDVSGSMGSLNKLPLVKQSMRMLVDKLRPEDRVAIVTYAGQSGLALPSTPASKSREIVAALDSLSASGSTNGGMGIQLAYDVAKANFITGGINRVILCTDGDFNVGVTSQGELTRMVEEKAKSGVALTALGFGMGNYKDSTLELLADKGDGNYGYIDSRREAEKILADQVNGTLLAVAKDVKLQVDFNPARVASYRLIGYEDRDLEAQDFNDDAVDAGEIGSGHSVTALYEIVPVGVADTGPVAPPLDVSRYAAESAKAAVNAAVSDELLAVKIRYKDPGSEQSKRLEVPLTDRGERFANASADFKFAAAVAAYGMILRESPHRGQATIGDVIAWAAAAAAKPGDDPHGYRSEFIDLARRTQALLQ